MSRTPAETQLAATRLQEGRERVVQRDAVAAGRDRDRHRIGDRAVPGGIQAVERRALARPRASPR